MTPAQKAALYFVNTWKKYVGYHEKATNSQLEDFTANSGSHNWNRFAAAIDALREQGYNVYNGRKNIGDPGEWCDINYDAVMIECFGVEDAQKMLYQPWNSCGAGCYFSANYYRAAGAWYDSPEVGDQIFFGKAGDETHTGGVTGVDDTYVYTIEGNANNQVEERRYPRTDSRIVGYGRPDWSIVADRFIEPATNPTLTRSAILDAMGDRWVETFDDLPDYAKPKFRELIEAGIYKGVEPSDTVEGTVIRATVSTHVRAVLIAAAIMDTYTADSARETIRAELGRLLEKLG